MRKKKPAALKCHVCHKTDTLTWLEKKGYYICSSKDGGCGKQFDKEVIRKRNPKSIVEGE